MNSQVKFDFFQRSRFLRYRVIDFDWELIYEINVKNPLCSNPKSMCNKQCVKQCGVWTPLRSPLWQSHFLFLSFFFSFTRRLSTCTRLLRKIMVRVCNLIAFSLFTNFLHIRKNFSFLLSIILRNLPTWNDFMLFRTNCNLLKLQIFNFSQKSLSGQHNILYIVYVCTKNDSKRRFVNIRRYF